jgi:hypothetical protein
VRIRVAIPLRLRPMRARRSILPHSPPRDRLRRP